MSGQQPLSQPIAHTSPQSKRNTKNLSLQLNNSNYNNTNSQPQMLPLHSPTLPSSPSFQSDAFRSSPPEMTLYRHPSLNRANSKHQQQPLLKRRTTLSLSIPTEHEDSKYSANNTGGSIPSFTSSSPISSPLIPSTPKDHLMSFPSVSSSIESNISQTLEFDNKSQTTLKQPNNTSDTLRTQTLVRDLSNMSISADNEIYNLNCYPDGPTCVKEPNLYLYSEPTAEEIKSFDLVVNVAKECLPPFEHTEELPSDGFIKLRYEETEYYYVPWTHTSKLCRDLEELTDVIIKYLQTSDKKILIHCQCGVSRSASLIIALFMKLKRENLNDSYNLLKVKADKISPNMSLIFQLMEWGEILGVNSPVYTPTAEEYA